MERTARRRRAGSPVAVEEPPNSTEGASATACSGMAASRIAVTSYSSAASAGAEA
ncbi:hypothetical protein ACF1DY_33325 [Streptomyces albus]